MMKLTYINENGISVELLYSFPYFFQTLSGEDGLKNEITSYSSYDQDGQTVANTRIEQRNIVITGILKGNSEEEVFIRRKRLLQVFNPKLKGQLIYESTDIKKVIDCIVEEGVKFSNRNIKRQKNFIINLICPYPFFRDILERKVNIAKWKPSFKFPLIIPKDIGIIVGLREPSLIVNVNNTGDVEVGMIIEFKALGTVNKPSLLNVNTGEYIKINKSMVSGEVIKINTNVGNKKITKILNGVETNILNYIELSSTFLQLNVGDNLFRYDAEENLSNLEVSIYYNPYYLGV